jgi:adenylylsulfate kinase
VLSASKNFADRWARHALPARLGGFFKNCRFFVREYRVIMKAMPSNIVRFGGQIGSQEREAALGQRAATVWLTGLPGAGKSTLAYALEKRLFALGRTCYVLDGDNVRHGLNRDLGFSPGDRSENIRRLAEVAKLMCDAGLIVIVAAISPCREDRAAARAIIGAHRFVETYVSTPLECCEARDPKGLYARARRGEIGSFTGISAPYEPPGDAHITLDTSETALGECVSRVVEKLCLDVNAVQAGSAGRLEFTRAAAK